MYRQTLTPGSAQARSDLKASRDSLARTRHDLADILLGFESLSQEEQWVLAHQLKAERANLNREIQGLRRSGRRLGVFLNKSQALNARVEGYVEAASAFGGGSRRFP